MQSERAAFDQFEESSSFEVTSKRRRGFPSEAKVKRGERVVHGDKELIRETRPE
jgi:hypothetical protein